jgi:hypothetical protein
LHAIHIDLGLRNFGKRFPRGDECRPRLRIVPFLEKQGQQQPIGRQPQVEIRSCRQVPGMVQRLLEPLRRRRGIALRQ